MIHRFVDRKAEFRFHPHGAMEADGKPFDIGRGEWSRTATQCATERILDSAGLNDPALRRIGRIARATEFGRWHLDNDPEAREHFRNVQRIIDENPDPAACLQRTNAYFDRLYEQLRATASRPTR